MMAASLRLRAASLSPSTQTLRQDVRRFLLTEMETGGFIPIVDCWVRGGNPEFSRKLGARGWLGMVWPQEYGGRDRPQEERFVAAHWVAERQIGPSLLRFGTPEQRQRHLPAIARGESYFGACAKP
ncbi:acyl-CoA dehydrogenase family protein [Acidocella sp.]|uniref:acyl-CoA dehydrogenase family protein n=1 Tax=Acidocella sp. TaxID=50710 RepID=UPI0026252B76|nr:acyl-CoA dehydrogenase family protein [Acidocella sp.]